MANERRFLSPAGKKRDQVEGAGGGKAACAMQRKQAANELDG